MAYIVPAVSAFGIVAQGLLAGITASLLVLFGYPHTGVHIAMAVTLGALILWGVNWSVAKSAGGGRIWLVPIMALAVSVLPCVAL